MLGHLINNFSKTVVGLSGIRKAKKAKGRRGVAPLLDFLDHEGLYPETPVIERGVNEAECYVDDRKYLMFCSNNYLSLSENQRVKDAAKEAIDKYGLGPGGSRVISGNVDVIERLEKAIAELVGSEDCLTFPTGYMANVAVFQAIMDPLLLDLPYKSTEGVIFSDEYNHGSIIDGCRLTKAKKVIFKHDDLRDLKSKLAAHKNYPNKLIVTEGVFSLEGEVIDIPRYLELAREFNAKLMIDDAHGIGVLGENGGGTAELHNCSKDVDIIMGCMDKAFGGTGGFLCGSSELVRYLRIACRSSLLSSALPAGMAGAMTQAIQEIRKASLDRQEILEKASFLSSKLKEKGFKVIERDPIPVVVLFMGKEDIGVEFARRLWEEGIFSPVIRWPAVPVGQSRFRILMMKNHTAEHLTAFISAAEKIGKEMKIIR